jgi:signal transduction histidine kinase
MEQIVEDARSLTFELSNPLLYQVGLDAAVESHLAKHIQGEFGIECEFKSEGPLSSLGDDIKVVLYQAVRELLANIIKHANASKVGVCITNSGDELKVTVEDDGVGFDPARIGPHDVGEGGFGLFNIRERLEYLGGNLEIESGREKGACVIMSIPIQADAVA